MCNFSSRLIGWLDKELPDTEAAAMDQHVPACRECRGQADAFREVSHSFALYARAAPPLAAGSPGHWWLVAAAAAVLAIVMLWPRGHANTQLETPRRTETVATMPAIAQHNTAIAVHRSRARRRLQTQVAWQPAEPTIQVIIPADALFPPGTFPEGVGFVADLRLAPDGSAGGLVVRP